MSTTRTLPDGVTAHDHPRYATIERSDRSGTIEGLVYVWTGGTDHIELHAGGVAVRVATIPDSVRTVDGTTRLDWDGGAHLPGGVTLFGVHVDQWAAAVAHVTVAR